MRHMAKISAALLLGSLLSGCSMAGLNDFIDDEYAQTQHVQMPHYFGASQQDCQTTYNPTPTNPCGGPVATPNTQSYGQSLRGPYGQNPYAQYGHNPQAHYGHNPYGHHPYVPSIQGRHPHGLRGKSQGFRPHAYGNLGVVNYEAGEDLYGLQGRAGYQFNKYFAAEAEGSFGFSNAKTSAVFSGVPVEQTLGIENSVAAFGVVRYPLFGKVSGYSRLGYHQTQLDRKLTIGTAHPEKYEETVNGVAYGSGLEYEVNPRTAVRLDYTVYDYDGPDADAISLAVSRKF